MKFQTLDCWYHATEYGSSRRVISELEYVVRDLNELQRFEGFGYVGDTQFNMGLFPEHIAPTGNRVNPRCAP